MKTLELTQKISVLTAIKTLSSVCDGAIEEDGIGFNKPDSFLNEYVYVSKLTYKQQKEFLQILKKYEHTQLGKEVIIDDSETDSNATEIQELELAKIVKKSVKFKEDTVYIAFEYNSLLVNTVKQFPKRKFNWDTKVWEIKVIPEIRKFLDDFNFKYSEEDFTNALKYEKIEYNVNLLKSNIIQIHFNYDPNLVSEVKKIEGRKFNPTTKNWEISIKNDNTISVIEFIKNHKFSISPNAKDFLNKKFKEAKNHEKQIKENSSLSSQLHPSKDFKIKKGLRGTLRDFQLAGVEYMIKNKKVILGDEMGTGKTIQSLAAIYHANAFPALVVCPNTIKYNWYAELSKWLPSGTKIKIVESNHLSSEIGVADIYITNYNTVVKHQNYFLSVGLQGLIIDESHYVKNYKSQRTQAVTNIASKKSLKMVLELSGTVTTNRPQELISQLTVLNKLDDLGGFWNFAKRYCNAYKGAYGWDFSGAANLEELHKKLRSMCYIRRDKEQVLKELPEMQIQNILVDITNRSEYKKAVNNFLDYLKNELQENQEFIDSLKGLSEEEIKKAKKQWHQEKISKAKSAEHLVKLNVLKQIIGKGKMKAAIDFIHNIIVNEKLVVFTVHKDMTNLIAEHFNCSKIDGTVKAEDRQKIVNDFQNNPETKLVVINIAAGREGLTLTAASKLVFLEQAWTPAEHDQAAARIHRIGQKNIANIYYLLGKDTIDEEINNLISKKRKITDAINKGSESAKDIKIVNELITNLIN